MNNTRILGYAGTGKDFSYHGKFDSRDLIGCVPRLVVREPLQWLYRLSSLGIYPIAIQEGNEVSYFCSTESGSLKMIVTSPRHNSSRFTKVIKKHGVSFSGITFFCSSKNSAKIASRICAESIGESLHPSTKSVDGGYYSTIEIYEDTKFTFAYLPESYEQNNWEPFWTQGQTPDPGLDVKLDHIVQNLPEELYYQISTMFTKLGFEETFGGADGVEFKTKAFSPAGGIFDPLPFFAINFSSKEHSQINVGMKEHGGPFIQHVALQVNNWVKAAEMFTSAGMPVMGMHGRNDMETYYTACRPLFEKVFPGTDFELFKSGGGLFDADCEDAGQPLGLQQTFHVTLDSLDLGSRGRLTCFFELIQRSATGLSEEELREMENLKGSCAGFGKGNFTSLAADVKIHADELEVRVEL